MKIRLGNLDLARGLAHRESPARFSLATERETQLVSTLRASNAAIFDRGNARTFVTFSVTRRHANAERALRFAAGHSQALANTNGVVIISEDSPGEAEFFLPDAVLHTLHCAPEGLLTETEYAFVGGALTCRPAL